MDKQIKPIIGTHNSMTFLRPAKWYGWFMIPFARCQRKTIEQQWNDGARCFDLRIRFTKQGEPYFAHGLYECTHEVQPIDVLVQLDRLMIRYNQPAFVRLILEDPNKQNHNVFYFKQFCYAWETHEACKIDNKVLHFFGGNRKGDWKKLYTFKGDVPDSLNNQWVSSMMEDARWYEKFLPFAYARRCNKRNEGNVKPKFNLFDFL